jgi:hypothetical protein
MPISTAPNLMQYELWALGLLLDEKRSSKLSLWSVVLDNDYMIKNQLDEYM